MSTLPVSGAPMPDSFAYNHSKIAASDAADRELLLFQWLTSLDRDLEAAPKVAYLTQEYIKAAQSVLEPQLLSYVSSVGSLRQSSPIRHLLGQCFTKLYKKGDDRTVFDTIAAIQRILSNKRVDDAVRLYTILMQSRDTRNRSHYRSPRTKSNFALCRNWLFIYKVSEKRERGRRILL